MFCALTSTTRDADTASIDANFDVERTGINPTIWLAKSALEEYNLAITGYAHGGLWWARLSAQIYNDESDFVYCGKVLTELCERLNQAHNNSMAR